MSAQELADRTVELGHPLTRSTIAAMESGRRGTVSVADLLVLAWALDVSPVLLVIPIGAGNTQAEIVPGVFIDIVEAADWFSGLTIDPLPGHEDDPRWSMQRKQPILLTRALRLAVDRWRSDVRAAVASDEPEITAYYERSAAAQRVEIENLQRVLSENHFSLPALPAELMIDLES